MRGPGRSISVAAIEVSGKKGGASSLSNDWCYDLYSCSGILPSNCTDFMVTCRNRFCSLVSLSIPRVFFGSVVVVLLRLGNVSMVCPREAGMT